MKPLPSGDGYGIANWAIQWEWEQKVKHRITCDEVGYPLSESRYIDVADWEKQTGGNWKKDVLDNL